VCVPARAAAARAATGAISPRAADRVTASACRPRGRNDHADGSPGTAIRTPSALLLLAVYAFDHLRGAIGIVSDRRYVDCMRMACLACKCSPQRGAIVIISKAVRAVVGAAYRASVARARARPVGDGIAQEGTRSRAACMPILIASLA
jgi:hypothetical protein